MDRQVLLQFLVHFNLAVVLKEDVLLTIFEYFTLSFELKAFHVPKLIKTLIRHVSIFITFIVLTLELIECNVVLLQILSFIVTIQVFILELFRLYN